MHVKVQQHLMRLHLLKFFDQLPHSIWLRCQLLVRMAKHAVHVLAHKRASRVADCYTISVQHRNNLEDESFSEFSCHLVLAYQELNHAMDNPAGV